MADNNKKQDEFLSRSALRHQQEVNKDTPPDNKRPLTRLEITKKREKEERENSKFYQFTKKAESIKKDLFKQDNKVRNKRTIVKPTAQQRKTPVRFKKGQYDPRKVDHNVGIITPNKNNNKLNLTSKQKKSIVAAMVSIVAIFMIYAVAFNNNDKKTAIDNNKTAEVNSADYDHKSSKAKHNDTESSSSTIHHKKHHSKSTEDDSNYDETNNNEETTDDNNYTASNNNDNNTTKSYTSNGNSNNYRSHHSSSYSNNNDNQATYTIPNRSSHSISSKNNFNSVNDAVEYGRNHINGNSGNSNFHVSNGENGGYQVTFY